MPTSTPSMIDRENPWPGLASYSEETQALFHGRDAEVAELSRRVQRKLLTVLFGQSGLGKTSMLRAGVVPRLRREGCCPVYVRIDYGDTAPPPGEQVRQAVAQALAAAGVNEAEVVSVGGALRPDPKTGGAASGHEAPPTTPLTPTLWEFLHRRGDARRDAQGREVVPLIVFDQFEEIFTLAQGN